MMAGSVPQPCHGTFGAGAIICSGRSPLAWRVQARDLVSWNFKENRKIWMWSNVLKDLRVTLQAVNVCDFVSRNQDSTPANLPQVESWPGFQRPQELGAEAECHGDFLALGPFNIVQLDDGGWDWWYLGSPEIWPQTRTAQFTNCVQPKRLRKHNNGWKHHCVRRLSWNLLLFIRTTNNLLMWLPAAVAPRGLFLAFVWGVGVGVTHLKLGL